MAINLSLQPLPTPKSFSNISLDVAAMGPPIPAIERIKLFSDKQWEEFVLEWADSLREKYSRVDRCGGAGDMGLDVIGTCKEDESLWDNYQCKHYNAPLSPSDIWVELGKLVFYSYRGDYTFPRKYYFVAPQGAGTKLSNFLKKPDELRAQLITNWDSYCKLGISSTGAIELNNSLKKHLNTLDFSIFQSIPPLQLIDEHAKTRWHVSRFGGGLPQRPPQEEPPADLSDHEANYVRALLDAYSDHLKRPLAATSDIADETNLTEHFSDSRLEFYSAESLRSFSRDTLPPGNMRNFKTKFMSASEMKYVRIMRMDISV